MIAALIRWSARNVFLVGLATIFVTLAGIYAVSRVPLDAIPDLSDVQVIVYTEFPGQAPQVVEDQVTYPLTTAMLTVPKSTRRARLLLLRRLLRLCDLRGWHRSLLGALARARISELCRATATCRGNAEPRSRRDRSRVGLPICRSRVAEEPRRAPHHSGLVDPFRACQGRGRVRDRERRRLRQAVQRRGRSAAPAGPRHSAFQDQRRDPREQHGCRRPHRRGLRDRVRHPRPRLHQEPLRS